jgi:ribosomal protein L16 Arg81 hydroxylase
MISRLRPQGVEGNMALVQTSDQSVNSSALDALLEPVRCEAFLHEFWGKSFAHIPGYEGKFRSLLSWSELGKIIEQQRTKPPRLMLYKNGSQLDPKSYLDEVDSNWPEPKLRGWDFLNELRKGSSLVINAINDFHRPIQELAQSLEVILRTYVRVNLYAGWKSDSCFNLHWDDQDTFILQVAGRKRWTVYCPTRSCPLRNDKTKTLEPKGKPFWEDTLTEGGLLYMPRGWWHVASPLDEPTLHLTVTVKKPSGIDFLHWFVDELIVFATCRKDIPCIASDDQKRQYLHQLFEVISANWDQELISRFLDRRDGFRRPDPRINLSLVRGLNVSDLHPKILIQLAIPRKLPLAASQNEVTFEANRRSWRYSASFRQSLLLLNDHQKHTLQELYSTTGDFSGLNQMIVELWEVGVVEVFTDGTDSVS